MQGRVSTADTTSGRAALGYTCNARQISQLGTVGGFRVEKYTDAAGHTCAYYDSSWFVGRDIPNQSATGFGTYVVDITDSSKPVIKTTLRTPAMLSPHESLRVNARRGLLAADLGNPATNGGFVDVYDISTDCRAPVLQSSTPLGILGHESGFAPDGKTFYVSSTAGHTVAAVDLTNPKLPSLLWGTPAYVTHGMTLSPDGNTLYMANDDPLGSGLIVLDVTQVQSRVLNPQVPVVARRGVKERVTGQRRVTRQNVVARQRPGVGTTPVP
jgi:hypothetical protein